MALFFFNIQNGDGFTQDEEGRELTSLDDARTEAIRDIRSIVSDEVKHGQADLRGRVEITDPGGRVLTTVQFAEAVDLPGGPLPGDA